MKLQRATRLGLYAVLELAADPDRQLSAAGIASKFGISINHLAKVLRILGKAGLVEAVRGAGGGYRFSGNAKRTTLMDVVVLFEPLRGGGVEPSEPGDNTEIGVALALVLDEINETIEATLRSITIKTMLKIIERNLPPLEPIAGANQ